MLALWAPKGLDCPIPKADFHSIPILTTWFPNPGLKVKPALLLTWWKGTTSPVVFAYFSLTSCVQPLILSCMPSEVPALLHALAGLLLVTNLCAYSEECTPPRQGSKPRGEVASDPRRNTKERKRKFPGRRGIRAKGKGYFPRATQNCSAELRC
ncbi:hypothetical protein H1C71_022214 [Ictidomys tridecemlineatus]|nr:hypothetical protein H1C71_022214 [Ictidomys tridecemlineatus]